MEYQSTVVQRDLERIINEPVQWSKLENSTILIAGATGMLGTYLAYTIKYLNDVKNMNIKAVLTYRNRQKLESKYRGLLDYKKFTFVHHDVVNSLHIDGPVDWIIHAASNASPKYILTDPVGIIEANTVGTKQLLELAKEKHSLGFHFLSTREVYGQAFPGVDLLNEDQYGALNTLAVRSCYPESKRLAETLIKSYSNEFGVPFTISRIAHSYGPGMSINSDGRIMSDLISNVVNQEDIVLKSEGNAKRAFCYISDTVSALYMIMLNGSSNEAFNVANEDEEISIAELAKKMVALFPEKKLEIRYDIPKGASGAYASFHRVALDTRKLEGLGWQKRVSLTQGIKNTVESF